MYVYDIIIHVPVHVLLYYTGLHLENFLREWTKLEFQRLWEGGQCP